LVLFAFGKDDSKDILAAWKDKKVLDKVRMPLINLIMNKCTLKALQIEEEFNLPLHIRMPQLVAPDSPEAKSSKKE